MDHGALIINARLRLTDEELVKQINENPCLQFFIGLRASQDIVIFNPSMIVYFGKRLPEAVINDCNERIARHGLSVIRSETAEDHDDGDQDGGSTCSCIQLKPSTRAVSNQGSLLIDATCAPADIRHPTDLSILNEACEVTKKLVDAMHPQDR
jgi:hypothetical protein